MPLPHIIFPPPGESGFNQWAFWHWQDHQDIVNAVQKQLGITLNLYQVDPFLYNDQALWMQRHQYFHNDMNGLLQLQGTDLQNLDLKSPEILKQWMWENWQEHQAVRTLLGI